MKCKVFSARRRKDLEDAINAWLEKNMVVAGTMNLQYSSVAVDLSDSDYVVEHTLVMLYEPVEPITTHRHAQAVFEPTLGRDVKRRV